MARHRLDGQISSTSLVAYSTSDKRYLGVDENSGGYPYFPDHLSGAFIANHVEDKRRLAKYVADITAGRFNGPKDLQIYSLNLELWPSSIV